MNEETRKEYFKMVLEHPKAILAVGGLLLLVILALFGKRIGSVFGDNEEKTTTVTTREQGKSAVIEGNGNAVIGDNNTVNSVGTNNGTVNFGSVGTQTVTNVATQYVTNVYYATPLDGPFRNARMFGMGDPEKMKSLQSVLQSLGNFTDAAFSSIMKPKHDDFFYNYSLATEKANEAFHAFDDSGVPYSDEFKKKLAGYSNIRFEAALARHDYGAMHKFADKLHQVYSNDMPANVRAICDVAKMHHDRKAVIVPSNDELVELKKGGKDYAYEYLNSLAKWGVLFPKRVDVGRISYPSLKEFFGFDADLEYQDTYCFRTKDDDGNPIFSNEFTQRYDGFGQKTVVNLSDAYSPISNGADQHQRKMGCDLGFDSFDGLTLAQLMDRVFVYVKPGEEVDMNYCESNPRNLQLCKVDAGGREIVECEKMEYICVPEPVSALLLLVGVAALGLRRRNLDV